MITGAQGAEFAEDPGEAAVLVLRGVSVESRDREAISAAMDAIRDRGLWLPVWMWDLLAGLARTVYTAGE